MLPEIRLARDHLPSTTQKHVSDGTWVRVARGIYLVRDAADTAVPDWERQRSVTLAHLAGADHRLTSTHWWSHESAAMVWGIPLWTPPRANHLTRPTTRGGRRDRGIVGHTATLRPDEVTVVAGLPVTGLARTVADCLLSLPPRDALVVADGALHRGLEAGALDEALAERTGSRGSARARVIASLADPGAESPGESVARFVVLRDGLPAPITQPRIETSLGPFWPDLGWEEWRLFIEYDGRAKYADRPDQVFFREKRRHDALLDTGARLLRATAPDLRASALTQRVVRLAPPGSVRDLRPRRELMS